MNSPWHVATKTKHLPSKLNFCIVSLRKFKCSIEALKKSLVHVNVRIKQRVQKNARLCRGPFLQVIETTEKDRLERWHKIHNHVFQRHHNPRLPTYTHIPLTKKQNHHMAISATSNFRTANRHHMTHRHIIISQLQLDKEIPTHQNIALLRSCRSQIN